MAAPERQVSRHSSHLQRNWRGKRKRNTAVARKDMADFMNPASKHSADPRLVLQ